MRIRRREKEEDPDGIRAESEVVRGVAVAMSWWMGVVASLQGVAEAGVIGSRLPDGAGSAQDLAKVQSFLENKIVVQKLIDYGVRPSRRWPRSRG